MFATNLIAFRRGHLNEEDWSPKLWLIIYLDYETRFGASKRRIQKGHLNEDLFRLGNLKSNRLGAVNLVCLRVNFQIYQTISVDKLNLECSRNSKQIRWSSRKTGKVQRWYSGTNRTDLCILG